YTGTHEYSQSGTHSHGNCCDPYGYTGRSNSDARPWSNANGSTKSNGSSGNPHFNCCADIAAPGCANAFCSHPGHGSRYD
ncbi:MAG TPA: hypothetical protein PLV24_14085, partial [Anaerolineaceae bacterium]|nr:hypothetical protein [Anaerolineaceae bacterium]